MHLDSGHHKAKSFQVMNELCLHPRSSSGVQIKRESLSLKISNGVGCHIFLQEIFLTQGSNLGLLHYRQTLPSESPRPLSSKDFHSIVFHCNTNQYRSWAHMNRPTLDFLKLVQVSWKQLQGIRAAFGGFSKPDFYVLPTPVQGTPTRPSCNDNLWNKNTEDEIKKAGPLTTPQWMCIIKGTQYVWGILLFGYLIFTETLYCNLHFYRWELKLREVKQFDKCHTASKWLK